MRIDNVTRHEIKAFAVHTLDRRHPMLYLTCWIALGRPLLGETPFQPHEIGAMVDLLSRTTVRVLMRYSQEASLDEVIESYSRVVESVSASPIGFEAIGKLRAEKIPDGIRHLIGVALSGSECVADSAGNLHKDLQGRPVTRMLARAAVISYLETMQET